VKEKIAQEGIEMLKEHFQVDIGFEMTAEELRREISKYDAIVIRSGTKLTADILETAKRMKIIGRAGIGVDNVDLEAATKKGIVVANAPQSNTVSAAEHTMALLLAQCRNIPQANASLKSGKWQRSSFAGVELQGKTLGIAGMGRIGTLVASMAHGFSMKVIGYDPYVSRERFAQLGVEQVEFDQLLRNSDFITVHLPKTKETIGMFSDKEFSMMKDGVRLINTARGGIYDQEALVKALKSGKVASVAIDVFPSEPCTESPLFNFNQVIVTPHLGASTTEAQAKAGVTIAEQVIAGLKGEFVSNAVNIPPIPPEARQKIEPFLPLCEQLGKVLVQMVDGQLEEIEVTYTGQVSEYENKLLTLAVIKGLFENVVEESVNYVNAEVFAQERGISIKETKAAISKDYVNLIEVKSKSNSHAVAVAGTLIGKKNEPRFVRMFEYEIDMAPSKYMAFFRYIDRPGMIGKIGTILGRENVNIASMQVGRKKIGGKAVMGVNVDSQISAPLLEEIKRQSGVDFARAIVL
jgi:D-3-phosphoglycerate dehydrogenase